MFGGAGVLMLITALFPRTGNPLGQFLFGTTGDGPRLPRELFGIVWWILGAWLFKSLLDLVLLRTFFPDNDQPHARRLFADLASGVDLCPRLRRDRRHRVQRTGFDLPGDVGRSGNCPRTGASDRAMGHDQEFVSLHVGLGTGSRCPSARQYYKAPRQPRSYHQRQPRPRQQRSPWPPDILKRSHAPRRESSETTRQRKGPNGRPRRRLAPPKT